MCVCMLSLIIHLQKMTFISSEPIDLDDLLKQFIDWQEVI